jgi:hypothetical protein
MRLLPLSCVGSFSCWILGRVSHPVRCLQCHWHCQWTCPGQCVHVPRQAGVKRASHTGMGCHSDWDSESESAHWQESAHVHAPQAPGRCSSCAQATASTASGTGIMMMHWQPGARAAGACTGGRGPNWHWQFQLSGVRAPSSPGLPCTCVRLDSEGAARARIRGAARARIRVA